MATLVVLVASVAALAALEPQLTPTGVALVALQWVWLELWLDPQQTSGEASPLVTVNTGTRKARCASSSSSWWQLGATSPWLLRDWTTIGSRLDHDWTTSGRSPGRVQNLPGKPLVVPAAASSAAQDLQLTPAGVALTCRQWHLGHQLRHGLKRWL